MTARSAGTWTQPPSETANVLGLERSCSFLLPGLPRNIPGCSPAQVTPPAHTRYRFPWLQRAGESSQGWESRASPAPILLLTGPIQVGPRPLLGREWARKPIGAVGKATPRRPSVIRGTGNTSDWYRKPNSEDWPQLISRPYCQVQTQPKKLTRF